MANGAKRKEPFETAATVATVPTTAPPQSPNEQIATRIDLVLGCRPIAEGPGAVGLPEHIEGRLWETSQRIGLHRLHSGLRASGAKLADGRFVASYADAVRWFFEQVAAA